MIQDEIGKIGKRVTVTMNDNSSWVGVKLIGIRIDVISSYLIINDLDNQMQKSPDDWYNYIPYDMVKEVSIYE